MAELRRENHLVAAALQRLAHEGLGQSGVLAVDVGGVEERHAGVDRGVEHLAGAVEGLGAGARSAEVVAAEANGGDEQSGRPDAALGNREEVHPRYPAGARSVTDAAERE